MDRIKATRVSIHIIISILLIIIFTLTSACNKSMTKDEIAEKIEEEVKEEPADTEEKTEELEEEPEEVKEEETKAEAEKELEPGLLEIKILVDAIHVGSVDTDEGPARRVHVIGDYAYVTDVKGLRVVDISDKANPQIIGNITTPGFAMGVFVKDDFAYVADYDNGLVIIDISDKANPQPTGNITTPGFAIGIYVEGGNVFIADAKESGNFTGLTIIDISSKDNPEIVTSLETTGAWDICVKDGFAYLIGDGLQIIDISDTKNPVIISKIGEGHTAGIAIIDDYVFVSAMEAGLLIIDVNDKENPRNIGNYRAADKVNCVFADESYIYTAGGESGLDVLEINIKEQIIKKAHSEAKGNSEDIFVDDGYAYIADYDSGLTIVEILTQAISILPQIEPEGGSILVGGDEEGIWKPQEIGSYKVGGGGTMWTNFYISWDITGINNSEIKDAEIIFHVSNINKDPLGMGKLFVSVVSWGERQITMDDFNLKGAIISSPDIPDFSISGDELINELQKAVKEGQTRFQIMAYFEFEEGVEGYQGLSYNIGDIEFIVDYEMK